MDDSILWVFNFDLYAESPNHVPYSKAEELMNMIVQWAESNDLYAGGGFRRAVGVEMLPVGPDYPTSELFPLELEEYKRIKKGN